VFITEDRPDITINYVIKSRKGDELNAGE